MYNVFIQSLNSPLIQDMGYLSNPTPLNAKSSNGHTPNKLNGCIYSGDRLYSVL